jgi:hypothetical protein
VKKVGRFARAAYTGLSSSVSHVVDALLGIRLGGGRWLRRQLKHCRRNAGNGTSLRQGSCVPADGSARVEDADNQPPDGNLSAEWPRITMLSNFRIGHTVLLTRLCKGHAASMTMATRSRRNSGTSSRIAASAEMVSRRVTIASFTGRSNARARPLEYRAEHVTLVDEADDAITIDHRKLRDVRGPHAHVRNGSSGRTTAASPSGKRLKTTSRTWPWRSWFQPS